MKEKANFDFLQKYHYSNSFWENSDVLFNHSRKRMEEYSHFSEKIRDITNLINKFADSLLNMTKLENEPDKDSMSTRTFAINNFIKFINKIAKCLKTLCSNYKEIVSVMNDKMLAYKSRQNFEKFCNDNFNKYKENLNKVNLKRKAYKESAESLVESFLNYKFKDAKYQSELYPKIDILDKKENEYKEEVKKCEETRNDYILVQRQILDDEEKFDFSSSEALKDNLIKLINFHKDFINKCNLDKEVIDAVASIDGHKDIQDFSASNSDIISYPPGTTFSVYNQNLELYLNFELIKNILKNKNEIEQREFKRQLSVEVTKFLGDLFNKNLEKKKKVERFTEIANNILNKKSNEEECNFIIKEIENCSSIFIENKRKSSGDKKEPNSGGWDNEYDAIQSFLNIFNKLRQFNKKMEKENFEYFVKINEKIVEIIDSDGGEKQKNKYREEKEINYNICDLLLILSSTFYMVEQKEGKEEKIYVYQKIRHCKLFQNYEFWVNIVKSQLSEQIINEKTSEEGDKKEKKKKKSLLGNIKVFKKKNVNAESDKVDNLDKYNQLIMAKLMSISFNIIQFVKSSLILNQALYNIFRFYKLSTPNRINVIEMLKIQIASERNDSLQLDEDLLLNNNLDKYKNIKIENINNEDKTEKIIENKETKKDEKKNSSVEKNEIINETIEDKKKDETPETEGKENEIKGTDGKENEKKEIEDKENEKKETEDKENERKETEGKENETPETEGKENERKETEDKENETPKTEGKDNERKETEGKDNEQKETECKESEMKDISQENNINENPEENKNN